MQQLLLDLIPPPVPTLGNFVAGRNAELLAALRRLPGERGASVYIWGGRGCGKSHLLGALSGGVPWLRCMAGQVPAVLPADQAVLTIDDVDCVSPQAAEGVFHLFNLARREGNPLLASGARPPAQLEVLADLRTRLAWGAVFKVQPLDDAHKLAALQAFAAARGFTLQQELARYLLTHWRRDMGSLYAAVEALDRYSLETRRPVTLPLLSRAVLQSTAADARCGAHATGPDKQPRAAQPPTP